MPDYRRNRVPGATYFFTVVLHDRKSDLLVRYVDVLRIAVRTVRDKRPFHIDAWTVMPDHLHCMWTLPEGDADYSTRWRLIKSAFSAALPREETRSLVMIDRGERGIWQNRFWEHTIRDDDDYVAHLDYTHFNPVKHGLVANALDWPFSSFRACIERGLYPPQWAGGVGGDVAEAGERR